MKQSKKALMNSILALLLCISMLMGTTFAWFTDTVSSNRNQIATGTLDVELEYLSDDGVWKAVKDSTEIFDQDALWEPGYTDVVYLKVYNKGSLALKYQLGVNILSEIGSINKNGNPFKLSDHIQFGVIEGVSTPYATREEARAAVTQSKIISEGYSKSGSVLVNGAEQYVVMVVYMPEETGSEANYATGQNPPAIELGIGLKATQEAAEYDSFGNSYDSQSQFPNINFNISAIADVSVTDEGKVATAVNLASLDNRISAEVPEGVQLEDGVTSLTFTIKEIDDSEAAITLNENEITRSVDVHIDGISENNTVPILVTVKEMMPAGLNIGNYEFYHVEDGNTNLMVLVDEPTNHNEFSYDPATGDVTMMLSSFSEIATVADTENAWNGSVAAAFAGGEGTEADPYIIANADQLAHLGDVISNDNANYGSAHYKLIADVKIGGSDNYENNGVIWYPIGYNKVGGEVAAASLDEILFTPINSAKPGDRDGDVVMTAADDSWYTYGGSFKGVFDGAGHTVSGIYQNTWAMKGDYDGHYYNDAMGLFGYVNGGTIKNLTIDNFYSEGEFAPTGCVTAYAAGDAAFENIAITNSHPQTYNTGVAGIVGWDNGGNSKFTFKNITVDDSNTISALWGSWDVAASGILGSLKEGSKANFDNCHVAATIDVYNDVCGNYQYYWYRYSGAFIGTVYKRLDNGNGALDLSDVTATNCSVNFGDRHEYYYCEFEKNTQASYTEDYQFSRVDHSDLNMDASPVTCKHIHTEKEDKQAVYIPYRQLFGGYGWGVDGIDVGEYEHIDITTNSASVLKFAGIAKDKYTTETIVTVGELFKASGNGSSIDGDNVQVFVSPVGADSTAGAVYVANTQDWTQGKLTFSGLGTATITITDYYFCVPTTVTVTIVEPETVEKFETKFKNNYTYRVGNQNTVALGSLFEAVDGVTIDTKNVSVSVNDNKGVFVANTEDWTKGTIQFSGTGIVKLSITDNNYCVPTVLELEVIDAMNATSATSATKNNVVLLSDAGLHTMEVSNGYTLYGNGFALTAANDVMYDAMNAGFVVLKNGTLDNVQIICPNFSHSVVYNNNIKESANQHAASSDPSSDVYGNVRSAVMADGNSKIINSYVHGGRAAIFLRSGNLVVDKSTISGGAAANIHTMSAQSLTLRNVTLIQKPFQATVHDTSKTLMGFSGLFECDENGNSTPLILEGTLVQDAWINESYKQYTPSAASSIIGVALSKTEYLHDLDSDGTKESLNLGFTYIPQNAGGSTNANVTDNRTNKSAVPYEAVDVRNALASAKVYSYKNTSGTLEDFIIGEDAGYTPSVQGTTAPVVNFTDTNADRVFETKFDTSDNRWESTLTVNLDNGDYVFSFKNLLAQKHGENLIYTVKTEDGTDIDTSKTIPLTASGVTNYVLTVKDADGDATHTCYFILTSTKTSIPEPEVADTTGGTPLLVVKSKNSDWSCAIPALEGIKIKYYTSANNSVTLDLATLTPTLTGKQNDTNNYWEYSNGYKLKVTCGYIHDTKQIYGMPVVVNNGGYKMYFTISSTNGYVSTSTSGRTVTLTYEFTDPNGKTLTFSKKWQFNYADYKNGTQYSYSDFVNGTLKEAGSGGCVTPDTLITLADGAQKEIQYVTYEDKLLVWDFSKGEYTAVPSSIVMNHGYDNYVVTTLEFADGTSVDTINGHGFFDADENKFIILSEKNVKEYIGHEFVKQDGEGYSTTRLVNYSVKEENTESWSVLTSEHYNCILEGMLTLTPAEIEGSPDYLMPFEINNNMKYNKFKMWKDIQNYGLYTYEKFSEYMTEEQFEALGLAEFKVAVGKGYISYDEVLELINIHVNN